MNAVPFELDSSILGLMTAKGLIRDEGDHLCLEYQQFIGDLYKGRVHTVRIKLNDITEVNFHNNRFGRWSRIILRSNKLEPFSQIPGASQGKVVLHIRKDDRELARLLFDGLHVPSSSKI